MGKIIAVANQKGGVGKSTTVINIAAYLGSRDFRVLCVDSDPQGNTTTGFGIKKKSVPASTYDVITGKTRIQDAIIPTEFKNVSIVPATEDLAGCELELAQNENRVNRLKMQLLTCKEDFDYIFIDCPPALGTITINGIVACDSVIVPMLAEFYALEGLSQLVNTIKIVKNNYNPALQIEGILFTMFDGRLNVANDVVAEVEKYFPDKVFKTKVPRNVRISEAPSHGKPVMYYDKASKGSEAYELVCHELLGEPLELPQKKKIFSFKKHKKGKRSS
ncbi:MULTISPECIES: ParA family protein [Ruminococcus]|uniref:Sporulation initiation inhibitor protein Soj n=2 Tax=Ruminococcus TaxID=1263 RepID=A0A315XVZ5_RUMFL|nr:MULTISPECIES: ParA family protein [Ruminococcus]MBQ6168709.1 ParA family protein [Ruminococcus sp.]MBR1432028.1 ParA family protein [Ruminococcus sp.]PWJ11073.1 chromosome partitioning protein [Ruminococcus flavefaciens]SSA51147.1 chromosome partitioning protein [Ruminococcus flavefaciens]